MLGKRTATPTRTTTTTTAKKEYAPSPAVGYLQKSKKGTEYLRVTLDLAVLGLGDGKIVLLGFNNDNKKNPKAPDVNFIRQEPLHAEAKTNVQDDF